MGNGLGGGSNFFLLKIMDFLFKKMSYSNLFHREAPDTHADDSFMNEMTAVDWQIKKSVAILSKYTGPPYLLSC